MAGIRMGKKMAKNILILVLVLVGIGGVLTGIGLWESHQRQQALLHQEEIDEAARRRRESWILRDGQWYAPKSDFETMLIIGIDKFGSQKESQSYNNNAQADFLILAGFDRINETTTLLHINRDTMTQIPVLGVTGQYAGTVTGQIALSHTYGKGLHDSCRNTAKAVSILLKGVPVNHYICLSMDAVPVINDMVGGVEVEILDDFSTVDKSLVQGEKILLKGDQSLHYIRARAGMDDSTNLNRMKRQRQYMAAFIQKVQSLDREESLPLSDLQNLAPYMISDCTVDHLQKMADKFASYEVLETQEIPGENKKGTEFIEYYPDEEALVEQIINLFYDKKE